MEKNLFYTISMTDSEQTVEVFLKKLGYSNKLLIHLRGIKDGLTIEGRLVYTTYRLKAGELLRVKILEDEDSVIIPVAMNLSILYEDEDILVVNKPSNMPIHPSNGNLDNTLANGMADYFRQKSEPFIFRAINRLDRDTTGLLILARHSLSACILGQMLKLRNIQRQYLAIVKGYLNEEGSIELPISRKEGSAIERCIDLDHGEYACTYYKRINYNEDIGCSLAKIKLHTGRTHQIRVHMKSIGHPLPGDFLYCPDYELISRQALHSYSLEFIHPITKQALSFTSPLPDDMAVYFPHPELKNL